MEDYAEHLGHTLAILARDGPRLTIRRTPDAYAWHGGYPVILSPADTAAAAAAAAAAAPVPPVAVSATPTAQAGPSQPAPPVVGYVPVSELDRETRDAIAKLPEVDPRKRPAKPKDKGKAKAAPARSQPMRTVATRSAKTTAPGSPIVVSDGEDDKVGGSRRDGDGDDERSRRPSAIVPSAQSAAAKQTQSTTVQSSKRGAQEASSSKISGLAKAGTKAHTASTPERVFELDDPSGLSPHAMAIVSAEPPGDQRDSLLDTELRRLEIARVEVGGALTRALDEVSVSNLRSIWAVAFL